MSNVKTTEIVAFAVLILASTNSFVLGQTSQDTSVIKRVPRYDNSIGDASEQAFRESASTTSPISPAERIVIISGKNVDDLNRQLPSKVQEYLDNYQQENPVVYEKYGIKYVKPHFLDSTLLRLKPIRSRGGVTEFQLIFTGDFHRQVRKRGRQLKLKREGRFNTTIYVFAGIFAALFFLYGTLKVLYARASKQDDYISAGRISMV